MTRKELKGCVSFIAMILLAFYVIANLVFGFMEMSFIKANTALWLAWATAQIFSLMLMFSSQLIKGLTETIDEEDKERERVIKSIIKSK